MTDGVEDPPDDRATADDTARDDAPASRPSEPPGRRHRLEGVIAELVKRAIEVGVEKAAGAPGSIKHFVTDMRMPKDAAAYILSQVEDTKNGMLRVVARETRDFLEHTNLAGEMQKILTSLQFEVNTTVRFSRSDGEPAKDGESGEGADATGESGDCAGAGDRKSPAGTAGSLLPKPHVKVDVFTRSRRRKGRDER